MSDFEPRFGLDRAAESFKRRKQEPVSAWMESVREPSSEQAARIDALMDEALVEELGRPLKTPEQLAKSLARGLAKE